jgi:hypothetical protein
MKVQFALQNFHRDSGKYETLENEVCVCYYNPCLFQKPWDPTCRLPKGRFTHSMPRPCRSLPCRAAKGLECVFPIWFTQCGCVWFTLAMPRPCPAPTMPFFSRPRHRTAVERRPVGERPAFGFFRPPRGVPRRFLSEAYQSQMQVASVKPNNVCHGRAKEW